MIGRSVLTIFFARIEAEIAKAKNGYVIDGNYTRAIPVKWSEIDTVIWLDLPFQSIYTAL